MGSDNKQWNCPACGSDNHAPFMLVSFMLQPDDERKVRCTHCGREYKATEIVVWKSLPRNGG
jgi:transcription elongation factor Elf1